MKSPRRDQANSGARFSNYLPAWLVVLCASLLFVLHFSFGGGSDNIITDSYRYVAVSQGEVGRVPFNTRILQPLIASSVSFFTTLSHLAAFELLTALELLVSLLLMIRILRTREATPQWQAAILLAFGTSLAVTFGYTPVFVDPLALLLVCLMIAALDSDYLVLALIIACLAALTKEYCVLLGVVCAHRAYRRGYLRFAIAAALLPGLVLLGAALTLPAESDFRSHGWQEFLGAMLGYHASLLKFRGPGDYAKILYMWSWCALWPVLLLGVLGLVSQPLRLSVLQQDRSAFLIMLAAVPFLLLGDWGRSMLVVVPFACALATEHPLARNNRFALLLATGGVATALARPFHGAMVPPRAFFQIMSLVSVSASVLIAATIVKSTLRGRLADTFRFCRPVGESAVKLQ